MHEFSIISDIFKTINEIADKENLSQITKVSLKIGKMRQIVPDIFDFAFTTISKDTKCESAILDVEYIPVKMQCNACKEFFIVEEYEFICPKCKDVDLKLIAGQELILKSIEGD